MVVLPSCMSVHCVRAMPAEEGIKPTGTVVKYDC